MPKCPECKQKVSKHDDYCPYCDEPIPKSTIVTCGRCDGTGEIEGFFGWKKCNVCGGKGKVRV